MTASGTGVCINGAVRTFVYPIVHLSIKRTLLPALEDPVVFASLTLQEIHNADVAYNSRRWTVPVTREALQAALVAVGTTASSDRVIIRDADFTEAQLVAHIEDAPCLKVQRRTKLFFALLAQLTSAQACVGLIVQYEKRSGRQFDRLVHVRPDGMWVGLPSVGWPSGGLVTASMKPGHQDHACFGRREVMLAWFGRLDWVKRHNCMQAPSGLETPAAPGDDDDDSIGQRGHRSQRRPRGHSAQRTPLRRHPRAAVLPIDQALPVGARLHAHFVSRLGFQLHMQELPIVLVRASGTMPSAVTACRVKASLPLFRHNFSACMSMLYDPSGVPRRRMTLPRLLQGSSEEAAAPSLRHYVARDDDAIVGAGRGSSPTSLRHQLSHTLSLNSSGSSSRLTTAPPLAVGVCLTGSVRTFLMPCAGQRTVDNVIKPLGAEVFVSMNVILHDRMQVPRNDEQQRARDRSQRSQRSQLHSIRQAVRGVLHDANVIELDVHPYVPVTSPCGDKLGLPQVRCWLWLMGEGSQGLLPTCTAPPQAAHSPLSAHGPTFGRLRGCFSAEYGCFRETTHGSSGCDPMRGCPSAYGRCRLRRSSAQLVRPSPATWAFARPAARGCATPLRCAATRATSLHCSPVHERSAST
jgi:hypothetical protein